jgi:hypothetical protein
MTLLDTTAEEKKNSLSTQMWYPNDSKTLSSINSVWKSRFDITKKSESFVVIGRPLDPFFLQKKLLMPKTEIKIRLHRSSPNVYLEGAKAAGDASTDPYKLVIEGIKLSLRRVLPHPSIISQHTSALARNEKVINPMELVDVRQYPIQMSSKGNISNVIYSGRLPRKLTIGLTLLSAPQGDITQGSFYFERFNLSKASVIIDSETPNDQKL